MLNILKVKNLIKIIPLGLKIFWIHVCDIFVSGFPISEQKLKGNTYVKQLDDDEIENLRVACKLGREVLDEAFNAVAVGVTTDEIDRIGTVSES